MKSKMQKILWKIVWDVTGLWYGLRRWYLKRKGYKEAMPNLMIRIGADTKGAQNGLHKVQENLRQLQKLAEKSAEKAERRRNRGK